MKLIRYHSALLLFIILFGIFLWQENIDTMSMPKMIIASSLLAVYVVMMSLLGEGKLIDEREQHHRYLANRGGLIAGTIIVSVGILYQLFNYKIDYWLLSGLIGMNVVKVITLLYAENKK